MTVRSVKTGADPTILKVGLSDGSSFFIARRYLPQDAPPPFPGMELDPVAEDALRFAGAAFKAERAALRLVAARERTRRSLTIKLRVKEHPDAAIRPVVDHLCDLGYVDDARFAALWVRSRIAKKPEGRVRLIAGLRARGVSGSDAVAAVDRALSGGVEVELARQVIRRIGGDSNTLTRKLYAAGFSGASIRAALRESD